MAQAVLKAKEVNDPRYSVFLMSLAIRAGLSSQECEERIAKLAEEKNDSSDPRT